MSSYYLEIDSL